MNLWQRIKQLFSRKEEPEDAEEDLELDFTPDPDLLEILDSQMALLATLSECEFNTLYDEGQEDKIKCVTDAYRVIAATQRALLKQIKSI